MTFWLDAQLDPELAPWLGVKMTREMALHEAPDEQLFAAGRRFDKIVVVTNDEDFAKLLRRLGSPPPGRLASVSEYEYG